MSGEAKSDARIAEYWQGFLAAMGRDASFAYYDCFYFELSEEWANKLLALVLDGTKRATSSSMYYFEKTGTPLPKVGDCSIVTDWDGNPRCVIGTYAVTVLPFRDMTFDIVKREGEDDTLESWQKGHIKFFTAEGKDEGYEFSWDMPVVFEDFRVVYK